MTYDIIIAFYLHCIYIILTYGFEIYKLCLDLESELEKN